MPEFYSGRHGLGRLSRLHSGDRRHGSRWTRAVVPRLLYVTVFRRSSCRGNRTGRSERTGLQVRRGRGHGVLPQVTRSHGGRSPQIMASPQMIGRNPDVGITPDDRVTPDHCIAPNDGVTPDDRVAPDRGVAPDHGAGLRPWLAPDHRIGGHQRHGLVFALYWATGESAWKFTGSVSSARFGCPDILRRPRRCPAGFGKTRVMLVDRVVYRANCFVAVFMMPRLDLIGPECRIRL